MGEGRYGVIFEGWWKGVNEIEQAFTTRRDMSAMLNVVWRPVALGRCIVPLVEQCVEGIQNKRPVFGFRTQADVCRHTCSARVKAAVEKETRITKLGTKWIGQRAIALLLIERIVGVAVEIESVESLAVVVVQRQTKFNALRQIWVRKEMTTKRNQVSVSLFANRLGGVRLSATRGYNSPFENFPQPLRCDWFLTLDDQHVALDPRLNAVEIG